MLSERRDIFLAAIALFLFAASSAFAAPANPKGTVTQATVNVPGKNIQQRTFLEYIPRGLKPGAPLLFVFHGSGGDGASMREASAYEFDALADAQGFVVLYPDGFQTTWNDCRKGSPQPARRLNIDDESFVEAMIAKEAAAHNIDRKRVFSAGWSNGGQLGYRFAMERSNLFAGVAAISASVPLPANLACTPSGAAMPMMIINGTEDPINPFDGGDVMLGKRPRQQGSVGDVADHERTGGEAAVSGREVVVDDGPVARRLQRPGAVRADIAGTAGNEDAGAAAH